jgi:hypothetical protein
MDRQDRSEGDGVEWRELLACWEAPPARPELERRLRRTYRVRRRVAELRNCGAWAAVIALAVAAALVSHGERPGRTARDDVSALWAASVSVSGAQVAVTLDLSGFEPVRRPRLTHVNEAVSDADLDGFVPVGRMTLARQGGW